MKSLSRVLPAMLVALTAMTVAEASEKSEMQVFKSPWCNCCEDWTRAMRAAGFDAQTTDLEDLDPIKKQAGVPGDLEGCHTAVIDGYVLEGHVPAVAVKKLLARRPQVRGLAVPGMPLGATGMGDDPKARYSVFAFGGPKPGTPSVFYEAGK